MTVKSSALDYLNRSRAAPLSADEERALARAAQAGCKASASRLCASHLPLVAHCAARLYAFRADRDELIAEGMLALVVAAARFDPERGIRFSAYAGWYVRAFMRNHTLANRRIVRMPGSRAGRTLISRLRTAQRHLATTAGEASAEAVAAYLGVTVGDIEEVELALVRSDIPDDEIASGDGSPEARASSAELATRALEGLSERDRDILLRRCVVEQTRADVAAELCITTERVRQLEQRALTKARGTL